MNFRSSASFGKRQEYVAMAELLRRGFDVYMTLVDDQQIDCVIRLEENGTLRYLDIQIKARSKQCKTKDGGVFSALDVRQPRENFYFLFYSEHADTYWVMPSLDVIKEANTNKAGKHKGKCRLVFCNCTKKGVRPRPRFKKWENAFDLLRGSNSDCEKASVRA
jgi:hypothetical protein